jgi:PD-(D/E)XK nuclease superfamily
MDSLVKEIPSVSPSNYLAARRCPLRFVLSKSKLWQFSPDSAGALVGSAIHDLIEWSGTSQDTEVTYEQASAKFDELIRMKEERLSAHPVNRRLVPLSHSDSRFPQKRHNAIRASIRGPKLTRPPTSIRTPSPYGTIFEASFESRDRLIYGAVDKITYTPTSLVIYDKKTCQVIDDDGGIKPEYRMQLLLYAGIVYEHSGRWATQLILVDENNDEKDVPFDPQEALNQVAIAGSWLVSLNHKIREAKSILKLLALAQPSPDTCRYCPSRSICPSYWKSKLNLVGEWPVDEEFTVDSCQLLGNGGKLVKTQSSKTLKIAPEHVDFQPALARLSKGSKIRLIDGRAQGRQYTLTSRSVIYLVQS